VAPPHPRGLVTLAGDYRLAGWYWHKTLWVVAARYGGPVLVRGRRIDRRGRVRFAGGDGVFSWLRFPGARFLARERRYAPASTLLRGPGCYALQIDGLSFSRVVVFRAVLRLRRPSARR
jgi:hypothetical protein